MPFTPWLQHHVVEGACRRCGLAVPIEARVWTPEGYITYSRDGVFGLSIGGRSVPCRTDK